MSFQTGTRFCASVLAGGHSKVVSAGITIKLATKASIEGC
jgi:hypothetical protein